MIEGDARIVSLAAPFVVRAGALAYAAKIYPQCDESGIIQRASSAKHDLVVHRAAVQRMWVQDKRDVRVRRNLFFDDARFFQNRFKPTVRRADKKIANRIHGD